MPLTSLLAAAAIAAVSDDTVVIQESRLDGYKVEASSLGKLTESMRDTPQSISTVSRSLMDDRLVDSLNEAVRTIAGITLGAGEYSWQGNNFSVRGFSARNDMFLNGLRDFGNYYRDEFHLQTIEVLKGPSSMLFGRGSTGGAINQVSKMPQPDAMFRGKAIFDTSEMKRLTADWNQPFAEHGGFRLNLMNHESTAEGRDGGRTDRYGVFPSLVLGMGTPTRLNASYLHQRADDTPDYGLPWFAGRPAEAPRGNFYGFDSDFLNTGADVLTLGVEHDLREDSALRASVRYGRYDRDFRISEPQIPANAPLTITRNMFAGSGEEKALLGQVDLTVQFATGGLHHSLVTGLELARETSEPVYVTTVGAPGTSLLFPDASAGFTSSFDYTRLTADTRACSGGLYALDTLTLSPRWQVVGGLRWDRFESDYASVGYAPTGVQIDALSVNRADTKLSYRAALVHKPREAATMYLSYGTSFNPSAEGLSLIASGRTLNQGNAFLAPENNRIVELGGKLDVLNDGLGLRAALFRIEKLNARVPDPTQTGFNRLGGRQRVQGLELEATGMVTDRWHLVSAYTWLDGKVLESAPGAAPVGSRLTLTPEHSASLWSAVKLDKAGHVVLGGGVSYVGERLGQNTPPRPLVAPGYWTVDAMFRWLIAENFGIQVNAYNLTDQYYFDQLHPFHVVPGAGRTVKVTIGVGW